MVTTLAAIGGLNVRLVTVIKSMGAVAAANLFGKALFMEVARLLGWGLASPWVLGLLCACGAATAGLQTYSIGLLAIEILKNGGEPIPHDRALDLIEFARADYSDFLSWCKAQSWKTRPA